MKVTASIDLLLKRVEDELRYSEVIREGLGQCLRLLARFTQGPKRLALLTRALSLCDRESAWKPIMKDIHQRAEKANTGTWKAALLERSRLPGIVKQQPALTRTIILKAPGAAGEKGVILAYFEYNLARLVLGLNESELKWITDRFEIILAASWTPTDYSLLGFAASILPDGLWIQPATHGERTRLAAFHPKVRCLPGLACDWINPTFYQPKQWDERSIDILMIANWGAFKRHWEFFQALTQMPAKLRVVLVGQKEGTNTLETIQRLAKQIGVPQTLDIRESLSIEEVTHLQCDAKISMVNSRREGGCVAMVESLFAGCAIAMREGASIGSAAHINERTGSFLRPGYMAEDLMKLLKKGQQLNSAKWATENVSCFTTLLGIEKSIQANALLKSGVFTQGLIQPHWRPYPAFSYPNQATQLWPIYDDLHQRFPKVFPANLISSSSA